MPEEMWTVLLKIFSRTEQAEIHPNERLAKINYFSEIESFSRHDIRGAESLSLEEVSDRFQQCLNDVNRPEHHQALKRIFDFDNKLALTQCICLGLGPFALDGACTDDEIPMRREDSNTSLHQLAVLTVILTLLADRHKIRNVYFQDPAFTKVEGEFLRTLGYTVLEDPAAFQHMSPATFLFAPFLGHDTAAKALQVAFPALFIGNSPAECLESIGRWDNLVTVFHESIGLFRQFKDATSAGEPLPSFDHECWTADTTVHWCISRT